MKNFKKAFTLVELLASIAIISFITSVILWNYGSFNDKLALNAAAQEIAVSIRQAQTYGINVKETSSGGGIFNRAYGIYFNMNIPTSYRIFADLDSDNIYDNGESVELVGLRNGVTITDICNNSTSGCTRPAGAVGISTTFLRPSPDARIYFFDNASALSAPVIFAKVQLTSQKGTNKYVIIESTGQVTIQ